MRIFLIKLASYIAYFPVALKFADITSIYRKIDTNDEENKRQIRITVFDI